MSNTLPELKKELDRWPGVSSTIDHGTRHPRIVLKHNGTTRFVVYSGSRVGTRGVLNNVANLRRALREMGATRA